MTTEESGGLQAAGGPTARAAFFAAYDRMLRRWPAGSPELDLTSEFGTTRVHVTGPIDAPPLVLLHAYQASSAEWVALATALSERRRIYAVDMMGDAGYSTPGARASHYGLPMTHADQVAALILQGGAT